MDNKRWRILGIISTALLILISTFQVIDWIGKKSNKISSTIFMDDYYIPAYIEENFSYTSFNNFESQVEAQIDSIVDYPVSRDLADSISDIASKFFRDNFLSDRFSHRKLIQLEIVSSSKEKVDGLHIELDGEGLYQIYTQEEKIKNSYFDHIIKLADLRPENAITVLIWTKDKISNPDVRIVYNGGVQKPKVEKRISGYLLFLDKWGTMIYLIIPLLALLFWLQIVSDKQGNSTDKETQKEQKKKSKKKSKTKTKKK